METSIQFHPFANLFPLISGEEYKNLVSDVKENGLLEPIYLLDNMILDGRNRYRACTDANVTPKFTEYNGAKDTASLVKFVVSKNLQRRHLTSGQLAVVALEIEKVLSEEARERQKELAGTRPNVNPDLSQRIEQGKDEFTETKLNRNENKASEQAARLTGTNRQYVNDAKKLAERSPELLEKVRAGELTLPKAKQELKKHERLEVIEQTEQENITLPVEYRKYRVIYADPPWKYGNNMPEYFDEQVHHYPLMTIKEICQMPIRDIALDNAVLFLWVTSPILAEAFDVIKAWGFTYKASFVWDKIKHNMGHYNSVRHEFLLVCTRGSCQPDVQKLFDSVHSIERTRHSEKPPIFREIIDTIYPHGSRIELFARTETDGWDNYGNEIRSSITLS